jgi:ubiquinone/menaquinone biosynthesis C-methylase UbiE
MACTTGRRILYTFDTVCQGGRRAAGSGKLSGLMETPLDELALAGPEHLDPAYVERYDCKAGFDPGPDVADLLARGLGPDATVVDLGAGTGTFALAVAPHCRRVVAVDVSPAMLAVLRATAAAGGAANVECVEAGFLSYEHAGPPADVVYTRHALHHLPDLWKAVALGRMARMLRPGGVLRLRDLVFAFDPAEAEDGLARWLDRAAERPEDGWTRAELETHLREEHSTFTWLLEPMLERAGFAIEHADHGEIGVYADYTCTRR